MLEFMIISKMQIPSSKFMTSSIFVLAFKICRNESERIAKDPTPRIESLIGLIGSEFKLGVILTIIKMMVHFTIRTIPWISSRGILDSNNETSLDTAITSKSFAGRNLHPGTFLVRLYTMAQFT